MIVKHGIVAIHGKLLTGDIGDTKCSTTLGGKQPRGLNDDGKFFFGQQRHHGADFKAEVLLKLELLTAINIPVHEAQARRHSASATTAHSSLAQRSLVILIHYIVAVVCHSNALLDTKRKLTGQKQAATV